MATITAPISNPNIFIKPSHKLTTYISNMKLAKDLPPGLSGIVSKNKVKYKEEPISAKMNYLVTDEDREFIKILNIDSTSELLKNLPFKHSSSSSTDKLLSLQDVFWLYEYIRKQNGVVDEKVYLHDLIDGSDIILPKNEEIPRSKELDKRCRKLKAEQENRDYNKMTKNVDSKRKRFPDDTIAYQMKQMNRHLVAIFQFILSVVAGFAFGFIGVELIIGNLDYGFRLLLGIICALIIALAELYFLAKKLNEEIQLEYILDQRNKNVKLE